MSLGTSTVLFDPPKCFCSPIAIMSSRISTTVRASRSKPSFESFVFEVTLTSTPPVFSDAALTEAMSTSKESRPLRMAFASLCTTWEISLSELLARTISWLPAEASDVAPLISWKEPYEVPYLFFYGGEVRHVGEAQLPDARDARRDTIEGIDHGFHVLRRRFGKLANFVGHDGESATGVARVCGFDGGVHRQEIGLRRDASDRVRHFDDEAHIRLGGRDEPVELGQMALSFRRQVLERSYGDAAPRGDGGDAPHGGAHLFDGRTYLADGRGLSVHPRGELLDRPGDRLCTLVGSLDALRQVPDDVIENLESPPRWPNSGRRHRAILR